MTGRGAWNASGVGGTRSYPDGSNPGPYYVLTPTGSPMVGEGDQMDPNVRAVRGAVKAYQRALRRRLNLADSDLPITGNYGPITKDAVLEFQAKVGLSVWGGIGPDTSKRLLFPDLTRLVRQTGTAIPAIVVCGVITQESNWDAGAVGFVDPRDVGLGQINAEAHPDWSEEERLQPLTSFRFVIDYLENAQASRTTESLDDSIASYNLGLGGVSNWISQGRPQWYQPAPGMSPRDVWAYISHIKTACA